MNNYIQNKLDTIDIFDYIVFEDGDIDKEKSNEKLKELFTNYHNHIVESWDKYVYDTVEDKHFNRDWLKMHMKEFISLLQDTNK